MFTAYEQSLYRWDGERKYCDVREWKRIRSDERGSRKICVLVGVHDSDVRCVLEVDGLERSRLYHGSGRTLRRENYRKSDYGRDFVCSHGQRIHSVRAYRL